MSWPPAATDAPDRAADLRLARLHVRSGAYALARAELEALAGADRLDREAILDLAEVRWRSGDLPGAATAAAAWLEEAGDEAGQPAVLAHVICAEAAAERGRTDVAEAHVEAAAAELGDRAALEAVLAGIAARAPWPWEAAMAAGPPEALPPAPEALLPVPEALPPAPVAEGTPERGSAALEEAPRPPAGIPLAGPAAQLVRSGVALLRSAPDRAAVLLALALRADRAAAEAVLAALEEAWPADAAPVGGAPDAGPPGERAPGQAAALAFVRAEALRAAGRHEEARIAYASAERLALAPAEPGPPGSPP